MPFHTPGVQGAKAVRQVPEYITTGHRMARKLAYKTGIVYLGSSRLVYSMQMMILEEMHQSENPGDKLVSLVLQWG